MSDFLISFGKFKGKMASAVPKEDIENYIQWLEKNSNGKPSQNLDGLKRDFAAFCASPQKAIAVKAEPASTEVATFEQSTDKLALIKKTFGAGLTQTEFELYISVANARGLDPLLNQIHAVKRRAGGDQRMTIQVGIDGYRLIAQRTKEYAGRDAAIFEYGTSDAHPDKCTLTCYRLVGGVRCAYTATANWKEYCPEGNQAFMWNKMPETMLEKVCEAKCLRMAFPGEMSGLYVNEEMHQADSKPSVADYEATIPSCDKGTVIWVKLPKRSKEDESNLRSLGFVYDWQNAVYARYLDNDFDLAKIAAYGDCYEIVERPAGVS